MPSSKEWDKASDNQGHRDQSSDDTGVAVDTGTRLSNASNVGLLGIEGNSLNFNGPETPEHSSEGD